MKNLFIKNRLKARKKKRLPLVSVVMPVYNAEKYVAQAIESILAQTYKRFELFLIDDASTDKSLIIAKSYKRRFRTKITIIETGRNLNGGADMCANLGIEHARGKYIARMDADDIAARDRLEKQVEFLEKNKRVFLVGSNAYVINKNGKIVGEKLEPSNPSDIYRSYATFNPIIKGSVMLRRIFGGKHFAYQIGYETNNDFYTFFKLITRGYIFVNLAEKLLFHRVYNNEMIVNDIKKQLLNTARIRLSMISKYNYKPGVLELMLNIAQGIFILILPNILIRYLYTTARNVQSKKINMNLFERFILPSSV